ncbi:hypothetical protein DBR40_09050 [Pedobacter sp. KBW01]|uniref:hypothetical protein n=1 Tax=Pedobacter sp. KBW01 TaxID=2153364 RepID=UPI000F5A0E80|nr:hypothetical protein [Pedobacter sp. KBW01]RQO78086.1 hypothetical protein DBR40_09050 [Pedobacter sp. KBW01]
MKNTLKIEICGTNSPHKDQNRPVVIMLDDIDESANHDEYVEKADMWVNRIIFDHFGNLAADPQTTASEVGKKKSQCVPSHHQFTDWEFVETTHYGDKDLYQRMCIHCGITSKTVSRLHPDANN